MARVTIQDGYGNKPTNIGVNARSDTKLELWIEQTGSEQETMSYMTLDK